MNLFLKEVFVYVGAIALSFIIIQIFAIGFTAGIVYMVIDAKDNFLFFTLISIFISPLFYLFARKFIIKTFLKIKNAIIQNFED